MGHHTNIKDTGPITVAILIAAVGGDEGAVMAIEVHEGWGMQTQ
jgi:hypothetical protein